MFERLLALLNMELESMENALVHGNIGDWESYIRVSSEARAIRAAIDIVKKVEGEGDIDDDEE